MRSVSRMPLPQTVTTCPLPRLLQRWSQILVILWIIMEELLHLVKERPPPLWNRLRFKVFALPSAPTINKVWKSTPLLIQTSRMTARKREGVPAWKRILPVNVGTHYSLHYLKCRTMLMSRGFIPRGQRRNNKPWISGTIHRRVMTTLAPMTYPIWPP